MKKFIFILIFGLGAIAVNADDSFDNIKREFAKIEYKQDVFIMCFVYGRMKGGDMSELTEKGLVHFKKCYKFLKKIGGVDQWYKKFIS